MRELEPDYLSVDLGSIYAIERVSEKKTKVYLGNASFTIPMPYVNVRQLVEMAKQNSSLQRVAV